MKKPECSSIGLPCRPGGLVITDRAMAFSAFPEGAKLVDVGCGSGATVRYLLDNYGFDVCGLDKDQKLLGRQNKLICAWAQKMPFPNALMDGVLMECSLSVMDDPDIVLSECYRVLKPNGRLLISDMYARGAAAKFTGCLGRVDTRETLSALLTRSGFAIELFTDYSKHLQAMWGQLVFEKGSGFICCELGADAVTLKATKCGYCLFIARKVEA